MRAARDDAGSSCARSRPTSPSSDILTPAPALAAELEGVPVATLVPHVHPDLPPGLPPYSIGARLPAHPRGRALWRADRPARGDRPRAGPARVQRVPRPARAAAAAVRAHRAVALADDGRHAARSSSTRASGRPWLRVVGPLMWEPPADAASTRRPATGPVVLVAPSTAQDAEHRLLRAALEGLARRAGARDRDLDGREPLAACRGARQRRAGAVAVVLADDAAPAISWSPTAATARWCAR